MVDSYNWTKDGDLIIEVMEETWIPFAIKYNMKYERVSIENGQLYSFSFVKKDLVFKVWMSRTLPFESAFYSIKDFPHEGGGIHRIYEPFIPQDKSLIWFYENEGLGLPKNGLDKKSTWLFAVNNQLFLLEKYCSKLLETGDISEWIIKHKLV